MGKGAKCFLFAWKGHLPIFSYVIRVWEQGVLHIRSKVVIKDHPDMENIIIIIYKFLKKILIFLSLKKFVTMWIFFKPNVIKHWTKFDNKLGCKLRLQLHSIFFLLDVNFDKSTFGLHFLLISSILAKF